MAEPKVTLGGVTLGKATVTRKHVRRGQDMEKKSRVQTTVTGGDTKDKQVSTWWTARIIISALR